MQFCCNCDGCSHIVLADKRRGRCVIGCQTHCLEKNFFKVPPVCGRALNEKNGDA